MKISQTGLPGPLIIEPRVFPDGRGYFFESYHRERYCQYGIRDEFVQDNLSYSVKNTLRGLHYQNPHAQAKLVQVLSGEVFDVAVDIRSGSPTFGQWEGVILSSENRRQFYIPKGFAHGFCVLSDRAIFSYKCDDLYAPDCEGSVLWSDPDLGIDWPVAHPVISEKDIRCLCLRDIPKERLPVFVG
jgi:dTDP-4-dehydrorhamnose 3,5-epimerase